VRQESSGETANIRPRNWKKSPIYTLKKVGEEESAPVGRTRFRDRGKKGKTFPKVDERNERRGGGACPSIEMQEKNGEDVSALKRGRKPDGLFMKEKKTPGILGAEESYRKKTKRTQVSLKALVRGD